MKSRDEIENQPASPLSEEERSAIRTLAKPLAKRTPPVDRPLDFDPNLARPQEHNLGKHGAGPIGLTRAQIAIAAARAKRDGAKSNQNGAETEPAGKAKKR